MKRLVQAATSICAMLFVIAISSTIGGAWADEADDCLAQSQPIIKAFDGCAVAKIKIMAAGGKPSEEIVDQVIGECHGHIDDARALLHQPPCNQNDAEADQVIAGWMQHARDNFAKDVSTLRGQ